MLLNTYRGDLPKYVAYFNDIIMVSWLRFLITKIKLMYSY